MVDLHVTAPHEVGLSAAALKRLRAALERQVDAGRLPGGVALIARGGSIGYYEAFGVRRPADATPMSVDSIFRIYSMTKPIVSVAIMMLWEQGQFLLSDSIAQYLPEFARIEVGDNGTASDRSGRIQDITIQDLLRHTSGLTYEFRGSTPVHKQYMAARMFSRDYTNAEYVAKLATMPLLYPPGTHWEYGRSTDVLGRLIEVLSGVSLGEYLQRNVLQPLGMLDTAFFVSEAQRPRLAEAFLKDPDSGGSVALMNVLAPPTFESGGAGLVSTAADYGRFLQMLLHGGRLGGVELLSRKTVQYMTSDHLGSLTGAADLLKPGYGFGLGFAVRLHTGIAQTPGSVGQYFWGGMAGTTFWVDPAEDMFAILLTQAPGRREYSRTLFNDLVYAALL